MDRWENPYSHFPTLFFCCCCLFLIFSILIVGHLHQALLFPFSVLSSTPPAPYPSNFFTFFIFCSLQSSCLMCHLDWFFPVFPFLEFFFFLVLVFCLFVCFVFFSLHNRVKFDVQRPVIILFGCSFQCAMWPMSKHFRFYMFQHVTAS